MLKFCLRLSHRTNSHLQSAFISGMGSGQISGTGALLGFRHAVADADLCKDMLRSGRVLLDFAADVGHIHPQDLVVVIHIGAPYLFHEIGIGEYLAAVSGKQSEELEFDLCQMHHGSGESDQMLFKINGQIPVAVNGSVAVYSGA